jgi:hypothetical protein
VFKSISIHQKKISYTDKCIISFRLQKKRLMTNLLLWICAAYPKIMCSVFKVHFRVQLSIILRHPKGERIKGKIVGNYEIPWASFFFNVKKSSSSKEEHRHLITKVQAVICIKYEHKNIFIGKRRGYWAVRIAPACR